MEMGSECIVLDTYELTVGMFSKGDKYYKLKTIFGDSMEIIRRDRIKLDLTYDQKYEFNTEKNQKIDKFLFDIPDVYKINNSHIDYLIGMRFFGIDCYVLEFDDGFERVLKELTTEEHKEELEKYNIMKQFYLNKLNKGTTNN